MVFLHFGPVLSE